jgi:AsmA protein
LRKNTGVLNPSTIKIGTATAHLDGTYETAGEATIVKMKIDAKDMPAKDLEAFLPALGIFLPKGTSLDAGTLNADLDVAGPTNKLITAGNVGLFNGKLAGFDLGSRMSGIASLAGIKSGKDLDISKITTNLHMAPDGLKAENFIAVLPTVGNLTGSGTVDSKNNLDFKMAATLTSTLGEVATPVSDVGGLLGRAGGSGGCKSGTTVPFQVQGTTADPKFIPDVGGLAAGLLKSQLGCAGGLGAGAGKDAEIAPEDAVKALGGLFKKKKP